MFKMFDTTKMNENISVFRFQCEAYITDQNCLLPVLKFCRPTYCDTMSCINMSVMLYATYERYLISHI